MSALSELRQRLRSAGFSPLPIIGKRPPMMEWEKLNATPGDIEGWDVLYPHAQSTGFHTRLTPTLDADILDPEAAEDIEALVRERFEERGLVLTRVGRAPKRCFPFRTHAPFKKITVNLTAPNGVEGTLEFLGDGQQCVAFGLHKDTNKPYSWHGGQPGQIRRDDLPLISKEEAHELIESIVAMLVEKHGYARAQERAKDKGNGYDAGGADWAWLTENILEGRQLHESLRDLAGKLVAAGMGNGAAINYLRGLMHKSKALRDKRWQDRFDDIPRLVESSERARQEQERASAAGRSALEEWDAGDDTDLPPPRGWLLGNVFCRRFLSSILGAGGTGKTALRYAQYLALATGKPITGEHVFQRCRVLIISLEDGRDELRRRIRAAMIHHNITLEDVRGWLFLSSPGAKAGKVMMADRHGRAVRGQLADNIDKAILAHGIDLVALDPFVKTHSVEENLNSIIDDVAQVLTDLATKHNMAVDAPHHISKGPSDPGNANRGRGASSMVDAARLVYTLNPMSDNEAKRFRISEADRWSYIRVDSGKINIAKQGGRPRWFRLVGVQLGNATPTYPAGDEVQTVEPWTAPAEASLSLDQVNRILDQLDQGLPDGDRYSDAGNAGNRAAWKVVIEHTITLTEVQARETIKKWVEDGLLVPYEYASPVSRKTGVRGLRVDPTKRPT